MNIITMKNKKTSTLKLSNLPKSHLFYLANNKTEDMWTPYKELQSFVDRYVTSSPSILDPQFHEFTEVLRNHRQTFLNLLKNPVC